MPKPAAVLAAALLGLSPGAGLAQIPQPSPPGRQPAPPPPPQKFTCPTWISAPPTTPAGYSRIDQAGAQLGLSWVNIDDGRMVCRYGSYAYTLPAAQNCVRAGGNWNPDGNCYPLPAGAIVGVDTTCRVSCQ